MQDILIRDLMTTLGSIIKKYRISQDKTIYKISAECSVPKSTWREAELGLCKDINLTTLWKISEGLNVPPYKILKELKNELGTGFSLTGLDE